MRAKIVVALLVAGGLYWSCGGPKKNGTTAESGAVTSQSTGTTTALGTDIATASKTDTATGTAVDAPSLGDAGIKSADLKAVTLTSEAKAAIEPKLLFNGADYSMLWVSDGGRELHFQRISLAGAPIGSPKVVYSSGGDATKVVTEGRYGWAFNGTSYLIVLQAASVHVGVVDAQGDPVAAFQPVTSGQSGFPDAASDGADFGVVYTTRPAASSPSNVMFRKIAADGTAGSELKVGAGDHSFAPDVAWNAAKAVYGIAFEESASASARPELHFASVDQAGAEVTANVAVTPSDSYSSREPVIVASGDGFALLFRDFREVKLGDANPVVGVPHVRLLLTDDKGAVQDVTGDGKADAQDHFMVSSPYDEEAAFAHFAPNSEGWGVVWGAQSEPFVIYFTEVRLANGTLTEAVKKVISDEAVVSIKPEIASGGPGKFLAAWMGAASQIAGAN